MILKESRRKQSQENQESILSKMSKTKKEEFSISEEKVGKVKPFLWVYYVIVIVFLVIVIPFFIFDKPVVEEKIIKDPSCGDGTGFDSCSEEKPYFCQEG